MAHWEMKFYCSRDCSSEQKFWRHNFYFLASSRNNLPLCRHCYLGLNDVSGNEDNRIPSNTHHDDQFCPPIFKTPNAELNCIDRLHSKYGIDLRTSLTDITQNHSVTSEQCRQSNYMFEDEGQTSTVENEPINSSTITQSNISVGDGSKINHGKYVIHSQGVLQPLARNDDIFTNTFEIDENNAHVRGRDLNLTEEADQYTTRYTLSLLLFK
ncbi:hypothetical protein Taro_018117 [Colocasia esculenta]|uniref:Uncharacterized protein n=1 Tax=Colocasia esculenta TaxID=4460 RepID=A0A843UVB5_COLES|nr:hypothetical protein [Colocasia esculenta]